MCGMFIKVTAILIVIFTIEAIKVSHFKLHHRDSEASI